MAYVAVPKDLTKVKSKVIFNLTKRQHIRPSGLQLENSVGGCDDVDRKYIAGTGAGKPTGQKARNHGRLRGSWANIMANMA